MAASARSDRCAAVEGPALGPGHEAEDDPVGGVGRRVVEGDPDGALVGDDLTVQPVVAPEGAVVDGVDLRDRSHRGPHGQLVAATGQRG